MQYEAPYGVSDPNAPYVNGNPAIGQQGSIPPAAAFEFHQRELVALIQACGFSPTDADLQQVLKATRSQFINYVTDVGVSNQLGGGFSPPINSYTLGMPFRVRVAATNTGPSSFDGGAGRHPIKRINGADTSAGDLPAGGMIELLWDGTNFQLTNFLGVGGTGGTSTVTVKIPYIADTSAIANAIVAPFVPAITTPQPGDPILVKLAHTITGPSTIYVNALPPVPVLNRWGGALRAYDLVLNEIPLFIYTGSAWQLVGDSPTPLTAIYKVPGTYTWVCPNGVWIADVQVWGAGSSGWNATIGPLSITPGGTDGPGGSSGGYCRRFQYPVTPGNSYQVVVGAAGPRSYAGGNNGGFSQFDAGPTSMTATGGSWSHANEWEGYGTASGGDINLQGMPGWVVQVTTGVWGFLGAYGYGASAPLGGCGGGPYTNAGWPGGGGGGGDFYGPAGSSPSGAGGDGGVIIRY